MSECWIWKRSVNPGGYGHVSIGGVSRKAHRAIYEAVNGPIPDGLQLDHLCRIRSCVNPDHLEPVSPRENTLRGFGPTAEHARKTHCKFGHPFSGDNLIFRREGRARICRECKRTSNLMYWRKKHGMGLKYKAEMPAFRKARGE